MPTTARVNELSDGMCGINLIKLLAVDGRSFDRAPIGCTPKTGILGVRRYVAKVPIGGRSVRPWA